VDITGCGAIEVSVIRSESQIQTNKPPRARRVPSSFTEDGIRVEWGGLKITVSVDDARLLVDAITPLLDPRP
jgi:hypothetical protein